MFKPKTKRIEKIAEFFPKVILELENILSGVSNVYIDWQNVIHWQDKIGWHISAKRLKQFFGSFDTVKLMSIYTGTLDGDGRSENEIDEFICWPKELPSQLKEGINP